MRRIVGIPIADATKRDSSYRLPEESWRTSKVDRPIRRFDRPLRARDATTAITQHMKKLNKTTGTRRKK